MREGCSSRKRDRAGQHVRRNGPRRPNVSACDRAQGIEAAGAVGPEISAQRGGADLSARRAGNAVALGRDLAQQRFLVAAGWWIVNELGDQTIPEQGDFSVQVVWPRIGGGFG